MIDVQAALGARTGGGEATWSLRDVITYQLGLGAGADPLSNRELRYVVEDGLTVLPSFATILGSKGLRELRAVAGLDYNPRASVHGEHEIEIRGPLEAEGVVIVDGRIRSIHDKGSGALVEIEVVASSVDGQPVFVNRYSLFLRGRGGFGGSSGHERETVPVEIPSRSPDALVEVPTLPQQALLYSLSGDRNRIHSDPAVARSAGFRQPILQGLCTYGMVCKALVDSVFEGDPSRMGRFRARFARETYPGETITVRAWSQPAGVAVVASVDERGVDVLTRGWVAER